MMRLLARSLAVVLATCLTSCFAFAHHDFTEKFMRPKAIEEWLGLKGGPCPSICTFPENPQPTTSMLEEDYFHRPEYRPKPVRCVSSFYFTLAFEAAICRLCRHENSVDANLKAMFFDDSLLASCPSLTRDLPGLEECGMMTKFEYFKSLERKAEQVDRSVNKAPRFHAEIQLMLQARAVFKLADPYGEDSDRLVKREPLRGRRYVLPGNLKSIGPQKLSDLASDHTGLTLAVTEQAHLVYSSWLDPDRKFVPVHLMDSRLHEKLIMLSKMVVESDSQMLLAMGYPHWSADANRPPEFPDVKFPSLFAFDRFRNQDETAKVWENPPLVAMAISETMLEDREPLKPIFEQDYLAHAKEMKLLRPFEPASGMLVMNYRGSSLR